MVIEQFLAAFHYGDAVSNNALAIHHFLVKQGIGSRIISMSCDEKLQGQSIPIEEYREDPGAVKILHYAVPSYLTDLFEKIKGRRVLIYHNITPPRFFTRYSPKMEQFTKMGWHHLKRLSSCFDMSVAVSDYNAGDLKKLGFQNVRTFPLILKLEDFKRPPNPYSFESIQNKRKSVIFVGRIIPNKKIEDIIKIVFYYKQYISPFIRLIVAGNPQSMPRYFTDLRRLATGLELTSEDIFFTGHIPFNELLSVYHTGDLYMSMSEHEGFCAPLMESCLFGIPIIAYDAGAIRETLDGAGMVVKNKNPSQVAELMHKVLYDENLNKSLKDLMKKRLEKYYSDSDPAKLLALIKEL